MDNYIYFLPQLYYMNLIKCRFYLYNCGYTILHTISLATIGVCVFVR